MKAKKGVKPCQSPGAAQERASSARDILKSAYKLLKKKGSERSQLRRLLTGPA
jgi:hypothetical protein